LTAAWSVQGDRRVLSGKGVFTPQSLSGPVKARIRFLRYCWSLASGLVRNIAITLLWAVIVLLASIEALSLFGVLLTLMFQGPRGVVGQLAHVAFQGHWFPSSAAESDRIFWSYTTTVLALQFTGLVVLWVAWGLKKKLTVTPASPSQRR
jgi:hypothetical protein